MPRDRKVQLEVEGESVAYNHVEQKIKDKKKQRRRFLMKVWSRRISILVLIVALGVGYFIFDQSAYARIYSAKVEGNTIYTDDEILTMSHLRVGDRRISAISFLVEYQMAKQIGIDSISLTQNIFTGEVAITVSEKRAVAYQKSDVITVYYGDGSSLILPLDREVELDGVPYMSGFSDEVVRNRILASLAELPNSVLFAISQINQASLYNDENMIYFYMRDGYIVISSQFGISALEKWREMISLTTSSHQCWIVLEMDETSQQRVFQTSCP